jgi:hypothetical protein
MQPERDAAPPAPQGQLRTQTVHTGERFIVHNLACGLNVDEKPARPDVEWVLPIVRKLRPAFGGGACFGQEQREDAGTVWQCGFQVAENVGVDDNVVLKDGDVRVPKLGGDFGKRRKSCAEYRNDAKSGVVSSHPVFIPSVRDDGWFPEASRP